jgi:hypothetical protein
VAKAVMRVFEANHRGYQLLERRISDEVEAADEEGTLFRANSIAAKLFGTYVRMTSLPYCWFTLVTSVNSLNDNALEAFGDEQGITARHDTHDTHVSDCGVTRWQRVRRKRAGGCGTRSTMRAAGA